MKRSTRLFALLASASIALAANPAFAQTYDYDTGGDAAGAAAGIGFLACWGILGLFGLALFVLNIWMIIDALGRQEYEFPNSTGNSKNLWVILLIVGAIVGFGWIVALIYYFQIFKKVKRGAQAPQWAASAPPAPAPPAPPVAAPPAPPMAPPAPPAPPAPLAPEMPAPPAPMAPPEAPMEPAPPAPEMPAAPAPPAPPAPEMPAPPAPPESPSE